MKRRMIKIFHELEGFFLQDGDDDSDIRLQRSVYVVWSTVTLLLY